ncbi:uncharacterized protein LOC133306441 [Gastrolobium bilobum]|uniref:uncharacterized protein LOC133306441 n=1 Tax=Gastrolobium bilobum TaxID=150636 RepID=UPI002AB00D08|nr:uncharacterized protein LOC133306441 [Gastrolobium bilobum]
MASLFLSNYWCVDRNPLTRKKGLTRWVPAPNKPFLLSMKMKMSLIRRGFSTSTSVSDNIVASVLFERLPVVIPKIDPTFYAFQEFSIRWRQQYQRRYPDEFLDKSDARGKGDYQIGYVPAPRITEADKNNDQRCT